MTTPGKSLDALRAEIDEIDAALHDQIMRRAALVDEIVARKSKDSIANVRPGREAEILRRLMAQHDGRFPVGALLRVWREIIAAITRMQTADYAVAVYASGEDQGCWDLARDQFGSQTPMTAHPSPRDVLTQVVAGKAAIGVVPRPTEDHPGSWWSSLCAPGAPRVVYRLPFYSRGNARNATSDAPDALAIAKVEPEASGNDTSLLVIETAGELSRTALGGLLATVKLTPHLMASRREGSWMHVAEVDGFLRSDDMPLKNLEVREAVQRVTVIGAYATPLTEPSESPAAPEAGLAQQGE